MSNPERLRILVVGAGGTLGRAVVHELGARHEIVSAGSKSGDIRIDIADPAITAANATPAFRYFQYFARFPVWTEQPAWIGSQRATRIDLTDLQFGAPNSGSFHCVALVDDAARVLESAFTFGSGRDLGWGEGTPK